VPGGGGPIAEPDAAGYGPIALYVGSGEVHFKDVAWKDLIGIADPRPVTSSRYNAVEINSHYYGWSTAAADFNRDGNLDLVAGPFWFPGPNYTERRIFKDARMYNPSTEYSPDMVNLAGDFTGDGWPDILSSGMTGGRPMDLHVNPKGESRRWTTHRVLPTINTEIVLLKDLDKDGKPEAVFGGGGVYNWAHPDPANPTAVWTSHPISVAGQQTVTVHGLGVGDVNSDGRLDVVTPLGWFEQPAGGIQASPWTFHKAFWPTNEFSNGGGEMGVYDVNGDGLTDVVAGTAEEGRLLHAAPDRWRLLDEECWQRRVLGVARRQDRRHERRQDPGLHHRQTLLGASRELQRPRPVRSGRDLHLPNGPQPESAGRRGIRARARAQQVRRRLDLRGHGSEQGQRARHRDVRCVRRVGVSE
jgi:hypothetical protein